MALTARCAQHPGMTCHLRFYAGASYLSCVCHSIKCLCPMAVHCLPVFCAPRTLSVWLKADQTLALEGGCWTGRGRLPPPGWWAQRGKSLQSEGKGDQQSPVLTPVPSLLE